MYTAHHGINTDFHCFYAASYCISVAFKCIEVTPHLCVLLSTVSMLYPTIDAGSQCIDVTFHCTASPVLKYVIVLIYLCS